MKRLLIITCVTAGMRAIAASGTVASTNVNDVLTVANGDSFEVTGNMSLATTAGATGKVENHGTLTVKELDLGKYSAAKGALAQVDNYGTLTIGTHLRMGILGTPSVFYNHEGGVVNKTSGGGYNFYLGANTSYAVSTLVSEGDFTFPSGDILRAAACASTTNHIILAKSGTFTANGYIRLGEGGNSYNTLLMKDNSLLTGSGGIAAPYASGSNEKAQSYITLSNNAAIVKGSVDFIIGGQKNGLGVMTLNDSSRVDKTGSMSIGSGEGATGRVELHDSSTMKVSSYLNVGAAASTKGELSLDGSAQVTNNVLIAGQSGGSATVTLGGNSHLESTSTAYLAHGDGNSTGTLTLTNSATMNVGTYLYVASGAGAKATASITDDATLTTPLLEIAAYSAGAEGKVLVSGGALVCTSNYVGKSSSNCKSELEVADGGVVSNVLFMQVGSSSAGSTGTLKMSGGTVLFDPTYHKDHAPLYLNPPLSSRLSGTVRGWGKIAFIDPRAMVTEAEHPGGLIHYGQVVADGGGQMRDLDCGRFGAIPYGGTNPNPSGCTNGWFAVNKGRLKLPRSLPRKTASHRCVGDYWGVTFDQSQRLANTFTYTLNGAELNNYMFAELYATDRDDIPSGLDSIGADKVLSVWRIGHFSDGPEVDEPEHPAAFTSATLRFRYATGGIAGLNYMRVYRHDGTANGNWKLVGRANVDAVNPQISATVSAPSGANWNMGWFAVAGRINPMGATVILR